MELSKFHVHPPHPNLNTSDLAIVFFSKEFKNGKFRKDCQHCDRRASFMLKVAPTWLHVSLYHPPLNCLKACVWIKWIQGLHFSLFFFALCTVEYWCSFIFFLYCSLISDCQKKYLSYKIGFRPQNLGFKIFFLMRGEQ